MWPFTKTSQSAGFPAFIRRYQQRYFQIERDRTIEEGRFIVIDCETTGISRTDQIITIGAITLENSAIKLNDVLDIKRTVTGSGDAAIILGELSGVTKISEAQLMEQVLDYLQSAIIVGHHISFDLKMIERWIAASFPGFRLRNKVVDTLQLTRRLDPQSIERRVAGTDTLQLEALCQAYGIKVENRHTALGDAYMTAQLFHQLIGQLEKRGITRLRELTR